MSVYKIKFVFLHGIGNNIYRFIQSLRGRPLEGSTLSKNKNTLNLFNMLELLHTHLGFIFPKVFPCLLVIISHYPVSYILGENIPPREYSLSVDTSV
jgi:hypothetical protein